MKIMVRLADVAVKTHKEDTDWRENRVTHDSKIRMTIPNRLSQEFFHASEESKACEHVSSKIPFEIRIVAGNEFRANG